MSYFLPTSLLEDGDDADAASMSDQFGAMESAVNSVVGYGINMRRGTFNKAHAASLFIAEAPTTVSSEGQYQTYDFTTFGSSITYATFGADGGTETTLSYTGDRAIAGHPDCAGYTGSLAEVTFAGVGYRVGQSKGEKTSGILVLWNVELSKTTNNSVTGLEFMTCIQIKVGTSWYTIDRTERFLSIDDHKLDTSENDEIISYDVPISTIIVNSDFTALGLSVNSRVLAVRAMVSMKGCVAGVSFTLHRWTLTAGPIYTGEVS